MTTSTDPSEAEMQTMFVEAFPGPPPVPPPVPDTGSGAEFFYAEVEDGGEEPVGLDEVSGLFESDEHDRIGSEITLYRTDGSPIPAASSPLYTVSANVALAAAAKWHDSPFWSKKIEIRFGKAIALAGDYYSNVDDNYSPICGAFYPVDQSENGIRARFQKMVDALKTDFNSNLNALMYLLQDEHKAVEFTANEKALEMTDQFAKAYHDAYRGMPGTEEFTKWTMWGENANTGLYPWLAYLNADHFGDDAITVYKAGHHLALQQAKKAAEMPPGKNQGEALSEAYLIEGMACRYLTDLFSSGHLRAPRRQFHSDNWLKMGWAGLRNIPVWDLMCRRSHDDDSATGLLVKNEKGEKWISYGDKQLLMPQNRINLFRVIEAVQTSVDEIFQDGFKKKLVTDSPDFQAVKLIPKPMLAVKGAKWNEDGWSRNNPSPLWVAESSQDKAPQWTHRADINDHSSYARVPHGVGDEDSVTLGIRDAPFLGSDAYPYIKPLDTKSGGFIQIMQTKDEKTQTLWQTANVWGPVKTVVSNKTAGILTLRGQTQDFYGERDTMVQPLHALQCFDGKVTRFFRFDCDSGDPARSVVRTESYELLNGQPDASKQEVDHDTARKFPIKVEATGSSNLVMQEGVTSPSWVNHMRIIRLNANKNTFAAVVFSAQKQSLRIHTAAVDFSGGGLRLDPVGDMVFENTTMPGFVKPFLDSGILLGSVKPAEGQHGKSTVFLQQINTAGGNWQKTETFETFDNPDKMSWSILVGGTQAVVMGDRFPKYQVRLYDSAGSNNGLQLKSSHTCSSTSSTLIRNYFTALIPSSGGSSDVLSASLHETNGTYHILFRTHILSTKKCVSSTIDDPLASRYLTGAYFTIKWIHCAQGGILQIFSWYGVLGARLFAPTTPGGAEYKLAGSHPYMGQTSLGLGLGCEGDVGYGFMAWGPGLSDDFVDYNAWKFRVKKEGSGTGRDGSWGMELGDIERPLVNGFDLGRRPRPSKD